MSMQDKFQELTRPLGIDEIEFRIQSINKGGYATILAYKDARVDINRLNSVIGHMNWQRQHTRDNHNCIVSIWDDEKKQWVSKEDTGTESYTEKEKGLASDSFKRACFNWGIGIELYNYPRIVVKLRDNEYIVKDGKAYATYQLNIRAWVWMVQHDEDGNVSFLSAVDENGVERYKMGAIRGQTTGKELRIGVVKRCYEMLREEVLADKDEPDYKRMQDGMARLTGDERIKCLDMFGDEKIDNPSTGKKRLLRNVVNECLNWHPADDDNPDNQHLPE